METKIEKAYKFAKKAHEGQLRKYTGTPYFEHPIRVAGRVAMHPLSTEAMICAAYSHDLLEDTDVELYNELIQTIENLENSVSCT